MQTGNRPLASQRSVGPQRTWGFLGPAQGGAGGTGGRQLAAAGAGAASAAGAAGRPAAGVSLPLPCCSLRCAAFSVASVPLREKGVAASVGRQIRRTTTSWLGTWPCLNQPAAGHSRDVAICCRHRQQEQQRCWQSHGVRHCKTVVRRRVRRGERGGGRPAGAGSARRGRAEGGRLNGIAGLYKSNQRSARLVTPARGRLPHTRA